MINLITLSDFHYLSFGLTLYESIKKHCQEEFQLHYLCLDQVSYDIVRQIDIDNGQTKLIPHSIDSIKNHDGFDLLIQNNPSKPNDLSPYHWALASFFSDYILNRYSLENILYIDSDIYFYQNPADIYDIIRQSSITLNVHRHIGWNSSSSVGYFNVGLIGFSNSIIGKNALRFWKDCVINNCSELHPKYAKCGDQAILGIFPLIYGWENIKLLDNYMAIVAPWNITMFDGLETFDSTKKVIFNDTDHNLLKNETSRLQDLYCMHFSHFTPDFINNRYAFSRELEWGRIWTHKGVCELYDDYYEKCKETKEKYKI